MDKSGKRIALFKMKMNDVISFFRAHKWKAFVLLFFIVSYYFVLPQKLFNASYATVLESSEGDLLSAKIAADGQWRFPLQDSLPYKFSTCIVYFEDEYFYQHVGFNPVAISKAILQNIKAKKTVRGGSTITQQVIRLARKNKRRSYFEKVIELILATRLECRYSKSEILNLYAAHAPFGGNVVGLEMASWRYFGLPPSQLSWAESATLAVLPNSPALIYPGKNQTTLLKKRNFLLRKLWLKKVIDEATYQSAVLEPAPLKAFALPELAPHLLLHSAKDHAGERIKTTLQFALQNRLQSIAKQYHHLYKQSEINNLALLVVDVKTHNIMGYVGNAPTDKNHQKDVDIITAPRSTGSILKPFLYAAMLDDGMLLPTTLVPDIPTQIGGYSPTNFNETFEGAVPAEQALARSLNVPAVLMLQRYGVARFHDLLIKLGQKNIDKTADHYGLSLILGGAESNLWDLCKTYANLSSTLRHFTENKSTYRTKEFTDLNYVSGYKQDVGSTSKHAPIFKAASIWHTFNAMKNVNRPEGDEAWEFYDSSIKLAWKTGTSFGNRDAWAIGVSKDFVVGVWVGNASGEGRPSITGVGVAAPILFDVFHLLPRSNWFETPFSELEEAIVCTKSGYLAQENCEKTTLLVNKNTQKTAVCPFHKLVFLDQTKSYRVHSNCESIENMISQKYFVLPPVMELYYKSNHVDYVSLPPFRADCQSLNPSAFEFIYPKESGKFQLAKNFMGEIQPIIVKVAHSQKNARLFWYLNQAFIGETTTFHEMPVKAKTGVYTLVVMDEMGNELTKKMEIVSD